MGGAGVAPIGVRVGGGGGGRAPRRVCAAGRLEVPCLKCEHPAGGQGRRPSLHFGIDLRWTMRADPRACLARAIRRRQPASLFVDRMTAITLHGTTPNPLTAASRISDLATRSNENMPQMCRRTAHVLITAHATARSVKDSYIPIKYGSYAHVSRVCVWYTLMTVRLTPSSPTARTLYTV